MIFWVLVVWRPRADWLTGSHAKDCQAVKREPHPLDPLQSEQRLLSSAVFVICLFVSPFTVSFERVLSKRSALSSSRPSSNTSSSEGTNDDPSSKSLRAQLIGSACVGILSTYKVVVGYQLLIRELKYIEIELDRGKRCDFTDERRHNCG